MKTITKNCKNCNKLFKAPLREVTRGNGLFCSLSCFGKFNSKEYKSKPNVICSYCNTPFFKPENKMKGSKSGFYFCCRKHKDLAQRSEKFRKILYPHIEDSLKNYRSVAFDNLPNKCAKCNYDKTTEILHVHHIDRNRENNDISNLQILCPTCHEEEHFLTKTAKWSSKS